MSPLSQDQLDAITRDINRQSRRDNSKFRLAVTVICVFEIAAMIWLAFHWSVS